MSIARLHAGLVSLLMIMAVFWTSGCGELNAPVNNESLGDSFGEVEDVKIIEGADNVTITVAKADSSYFSLEFMGITPNSIIGNGIREGWCIDWETPISASTYHGIRLYSTEGVESWKEINTLLNIKGQIMREDPEVTYRELQVAIWVLRHRPAFDLDTVTAESLPSDLVLNGQPKR